MSSIRERLLGDSSNNISNNSTIRTRLGVTDDYRKKLTISNSTIDIDSYRARKKELEEKIANYDREEKVKWWDKDNNVIENIGNVFYKAFIEQQDNKYVEDENYNKLLEEYKNIDKQIDDYIVNNKTYSNDIQGTADKFVDVASGNLIVSAKGVESTTKKLLGQTPKVETTLQERLSNKALSESKGIEKVALDLWGNTVRMTPQMFTGNSTVSLALSFANYGGSAYNQAKEEGYSEKQATMYGATIGTLETALTKLLGGFEKVYGKSIAGNVTQKIMKKIISNPSLRRYITSVSGEFTEEYLQEFLDPIVRNVILEEENGADFWNASNLEEGIKQLSKNLFNKENLYAGALGALSSGIVDSSYLVDVYNSRNNNTNVKNDSSKSSINMPTVNDIVKQESNINSNDVILPTINDFSKNNTNETNNIFSKQVDEVINGTYPKKDMLIVSESTPQILQELGLKNLPITMTQKHLDTIMNKEGKYSGANYHNLGVDVVKQLPEALARPLNVLKSSTKNDSIVVVTDLSDLNDNIVIASIAIDGKGRINDIIIDSNVMTSAYGKNNYDIWMQKNKDNIIYDIDEDTKKGNSTRIQYPRSTIPFVANNIPQSNQNVKSGILPITNNMQNSENNAINMPPVENKQLPKDPTRAESYEEPEKLANILKERPVTTEEKDGWLKKLLTIKILDKGYYVDKLARQTKNKELSSKYDYMLMANGVAQQIIGNERFNPKTQKSEGNGLHKIFEPIENSGKLQDFSEYMYHKHNISRMSLNTLFQEDNKPIFGDSVNSDTSKNIVEKFESENPEFIEWSQEIYDYNNFLLDILVDYGVISKEDKAYYNKKYPYYIPTIRATDKTKVQMDLIGKKATINTPIKKAKGGNQNIIPLKEAMALRTMQTMNSALRNNFGNELLNTIEAETEINKVNVDEVVGDDIDVEDFLTEATNKNPATLTIFKNGEKITFDISNEIYEALSPSQRHKFKILNKISKIRRALITEYNPAFMLTNPIKDIQDGALNSKHSTLFLKNIAEATKQIATKGDFYKLYLANGGSYETYFNYGEGYNKIPTKRGMLDPRKILKKISQANQYIEMTPRLAEFISSLEAGDSIETAMYNAQEITTNFKRGGNWTKNLDANGMTFLNASVQGTVKQIRNFQEAKSQGIKGVTNLAVKWSIAGLTPYILSQLIWGDDEEYEELSDYVKNNYYILWKNEDGTFVRISKGRVVSVIQNLFKQPLDTLKGEKIDVKEFVELMQNQVLPSDPTESNIISPLLDVAQNKTWYGGDLIPQRLQSLPVEEQYDESTDSISIWLGQKLGISPIKINYILDQYSGAIGDIILPTLTLEAENDSNSFMSNLLAPMKDKFTTDSVMNNQNISDLYDLDDELTKKSKSSNATTEDILKSKYINSIQTEMNKLTAEKRTIQNDTTLTNNEKYKQVREIQKQINELAKEGLNNYQNIEIYDNYAKVGNKEYYKNSSDEWQKLDTTTAKYKTANQITTYDKYLTFQNEIDTLKDKYDNTTQRKKAVINYVNSLELSIPQKAMLIKLNYSSFDSYNKQIIEYINSQDLSKTEKTEILTKLGFTIKDGKVYY